MRYNIHVLSTEQALFTRCCENWGSPIWFFGGGGAGLFCILDLMSSSIFQGGWHVQTDTTPVCVELFPGIEKRQIQLHVAFGWVVWGSSVLRDMLSQRTQAQRQGCAVLA